MSHPTAAAPESHQTVYGRAFWLTYLANTSLMVTVSLLFRYGDFVASIGGGEAELGWIVGVGAVGSLAMRCAQGVGIDRHGPRLVWISSLVVVLVALLGHLAIDSAEGPLVYVVRLAYHCGLAGAFGASITFISLRAPVVRMAEMIGMLGSSGFVGMALGSNLGDWITGAGGDSEMAVPRLFLAAAALTGISLTAAIAATQGQLRPPRRRKISVWGLLARYHPGGMLIMGIAMGIGLGLPGTFLSPFARTVGIANIGTFFSAYAVTAFVLRLATRRVPDRLGPTPTSLLGMGFVILALLLFLTVDAGWKLVLPGIATGAGHALLFPAIIAGGSRTFPARYRGLGVTLMLATFDLGNLLGMPAVGTLVEAAEQQGWPAYPTMFLSVAGLLLLASIAFRLCGVRQATKLKLRRACPV